MMNLGFFSFLSLFFLYFFLILLFFILDLDKRYNVMLHVIIIQVTKHDKDMISVTELSHMSQSQSHNHVTQRRI